MLISIIIPTYNVAPYVGECLDSIAAQTYKGDVECILVDDCSTDNTRDVVAQWLEGYQGDVKFSTINLPLNQRQGNARNVGIQHAIGDYILFVDSDDIISPDCLHDMVATIKEHPDADYVLCNMEDMSNGQLAISKDIPSYSNDTQWIMRQSLFYFGIIPAGSVNKLIRKDIITKHNIYFPAGIIYEDVQFSFLLGLYTKTVCICPQSITYFYRTHRKGSTITSISKDANYGFKSRLILLRNLLNRLTNVRHQLQVNALLCRYFLYMQLTDKNILRKHDKEMKSIENEFLRETTGLLKSAFKIYHILPISLRKVNLTNRIFTKIIKLYS